MKQAFIFIFVVAAVTSFAQYEKGGKFLEARFRYDSDKSTIEASGSETESKTLFYQINSGVGYALKANQLLSASLFFTSERVTTSSTFLGSTFITDRQILNHFGLQVGYEYLFRISDRIYISPFVSSSIGLGGITFERLAFETTADFFEFDLTFTPRIHYIIKNWSIIASYTVIQFFNRKTTYEAGTTRGPNRISEDDLRTDSGLRSLSLGVRYNLKSKKHE